MGTYQDFLREKQRKDQTLGFDPLWIPDFLFPFQRKLVEWAIRKGRAAVFAECGLGKTPMQLVWVENVLRKENKPVLVLTPLAVAPQTVREGEKFGIECKQSRDGKVWKGINVTNYHKLHLFSPEDFSGVVLDESSILKNFDGKYRKSITSFLAKVQYRLLCTATPAPNDFMELGTSSEALGMMGRNQMLAMFFSNCGDSTQQWVLKGHAQSRFWQWVAMWARAIRKPSDLGFSDEGFILPKLSTHRHMIPTGKRGESGFLPFLARTLTDQRKERRLTLVPRCEKMTELVPKKDPCIIWCHLNNESDLLGKLIPDAVEVRGSDKDEVKEERLNAFSTGKIRVLISKPQIAGFGLNWQHCSDVIYLPSHSHEQYYQAIRRCWRFGQKREVSCHLVAAESEKLVMDNMLRKEKQSEEIYSGIVREMGNVLSTKEETGPVCKVEVPKWLK